MELDYYCEQLIKYYDLYVNEVVIEVKNSLRLVCIKFATLINDILIKEGEKSLL